MIIHPETCDQILGETKGLGPPVAGTLVAESFSRLARAACSPAQGEAVASQPGTALRPVDLEDADDARACVDQAGRTMGFVSAPCIAGASTDRGSILDTTPGVWDRTIAMNDQGQSFVFKRVARLARGRAPGKQRDDSFHSRALRAKYSRPLFCLAGGAGKCHRDCGQCASGEPNSREWHQLRLDGHARRRLFPAALSWRKENGWLRQPEACQPFGIRVNTTHVAGLASYLLGPNSGVMT